MKKVLIDFSTCGGPVFSGRPRGAALRDSFGLDDIDLDNNQVVDVRIPENTYSITSSFFLGFFGPSVVRAGSREAFFKKYHFEAKPVLQNAFQGYVANALQAKQLFS